MQYSVLRAFCPSDWPEAHFLMYASRARRGRASDDLGSAEETGTSERAWRWILERFRNVSERDGMGNVVSLAAKRATPHMDLGLRRRRRHTAG